MVDSPPLMVPAPDARNVPITSNVVGNWYHLCAVVTLSGSTVTYSLWVNGRSVLTTTNAFNPATYPIVSIGNTPSGNTSSNGQCAQGKIEDIRMWSRALSSSEVGRVYGLKSGGVYRDVNTGYVGVNMAGSLPAYNLDVGGTARSTQMLVGNSTDNASYRLISALNTNMSTNSTNYVCFGQSASTLNQAELSFSYIGPGSPSNSTRIGFYAGSAGQLCYTAGGLFGVNTTTPGAALDLIGSTTSGLCIAKFGSNTAGVSITQNYPTLGFNSYWSGSATVAMATGWCSAFIFNPSNGVMTLSSSTASANAGSAPAYSSPLSISSTKVGVFNASPSATLDVVGTFNLSGTSALNGNVTVGTSSTSPNSLLVQTSGTGVAGIGCDAAYSYGASMGITGGSSPNFLGFCVGSGLGTYTPSQARAHERLGASSRFH